MSQLNVISSAQGRISIRRMPKGNYDVDRGNFVAGEIYYAGGINPLTRSIEKSHAWYLGCKFRCLVDGTTEPPLWNSPYWEFEEGNPDLELLWVGSEDSVDMDDPEITLAVTARLYNQDLTGQRALKWDWTRESWHGGVQDTLEDGLWDNDHENTGNTQVLKLADMNYRFSKHPEKLVFTVTATLIGADGNPVENISGPLSAKMRITI